MINQEDNRGIVGSQMLDGLIHFLQDANVKLSHKMLLILLEVVSQLIMTLLPRHYFFKAVVLSVYNKALVFACPERQSDRKQDSKDLEDSTHASVTRVHSMHLIHTFY